MPNNVADFFPILFLRDFLIGMVGLSIILLVHGTCVIRLIHRFELLEIKYIKHEQFYKVLFNFYLTFIAIAMVHILEITLWAMGINIFGLINSPVDALIFAGSCYTTVGFIEDIMPTGWKFLAFFISFSGLFTLAWTTSSMVGVMGSHKEMWKRIQAAKRQEIQRSTKDKS
jgi:hypothetical protein